MGIDNKSGCIAKCLKNGILSNLLPLNPAVWSVCRKLTWQVFWDYFRIGGHPTGTRKASTGRSMNALAEITGQKSESTLKSCL